MGSEMCIRDRQTGQPDLSGRFVHERYYYGVWDSDMPADPRPVDGAVYSHRSDDPGRGNSPAHHRRRFYRLGGFCYLFRRIGGTWKRHPVLTDFPLPVCSSYYPDCVFTQQAFRSGWRLECILDHRGDYCDHFHLCLPQGNSKAVINYAVRGKIYQLHQREKWEISLWRINKRLKLLRSAFSIVQKTSVSPLRKSGAGRTFCVKNGVIDQLLESAFFPSFSSLVQSNLQAKPEIIKKSVKKRGTPAIYRGVL